MATKLKNMLIFTISILVTSMVLILAGYLITKSAHAQYQGIYTNPYTSPTTGGYTIQPTIPGTSLPSYNSPGYVIQPNMAPSPYLRGINPLARQFLSPC